MTLSYLCTEHENDRRLFSVLHYQMRLSTGLIKRIKYETDFIVNGVPQHTDYLLHTGDRIVLTLPEESADFPPEPGELNILYEDEALIALHKPAGIIIHPSATRNTGTLANRVIAHTGGTAHPLNRLDRDTTGVILFAKNGYIKSILTDDMLHGRVHKTYCACVYGSLPAESGVIELPIDRIGPDSLYRRISPDGQPARTGYQLIRQADRWSLYDFTPYTGRTHQIRLHCFALGAPILGDPFYSDGEAREFSLSLGLTTQLLCCRKLAFRHPLSGDDMVIECRPEFYSFPWF